MRALKIRPEDTVATILEDVEAGGTAIFTEPGEMIGTEDILTRRAANPEVERRILRMIANEETRWKALESEPTWMSPGNVDGGLTPPDLGVRGQPTRRSQGQVQQDPRDRIGARLRIQTEIFIHLSLTKNIHSILFKRGYAIPAP